MKCKQCGKEQNEVIIDDNELSLSLYLDNKENYPELCAECYTKKSDSDADEKKQKSIIVSCLICNKQGIYTQSDKHDPQNFLFADDFKYADDTSSPFLFYLCPNCFYRKDWDKWCDESEEKLKEFENKIKEAHVDAKE